MIDFLSDNLWVTFLAIAVVLAIIEIFSLDLVLLMFAIGSLAAAAVASLSGPVWVAVLVFALVSLALMFLVRPPLVARLHDGPTLKTGHEAQVGRSAIVVEPVDIRNGRVQLAGELWSARTASEDETYEPGTEVQVTRIAGATAVVTKMER